MAAVCPLARMMMGVPVKPRGGVGVAAVGLVHQHEDVLVGVEHPLPAGLLNVSALEGLAEPDSQAVHHTNSGGDGFEIFARLPLVDHVVIDG